MQFPKFRMIDTGGETIEKNSVWVYVCSVVLYSMFYGICIADWTYVACVRSATIVQIQLLPSLRMRTSAEIFHRTNQTKNGVFDPNRDTVFAPINPVLPQLEQPHLVLAFGSSDSFLALRIFVPLSLQPNRGPAWVMYAVFVWLNLCFLLAEP
jgi:hypothetical protein